MARKPTTIGEPEAIREARQAICSQGFADFLSENYRYIGDQKNFIAYLDQFLQDFGQGVGFATSHYQLRNKPIDASIYLGEFDTFFATDTQGKAAGDLKRFDGVDHIGDAICLGGHAAKTAFLLPIEILFQLSQHNCDPAIYAKSTLGTILPHFDHRMLGLSIGAHETMHIGDQLHRKRYAHDLATMPPYMEETGMNKAAVSANYTTIINHPIEVRAQRMARLALKHFGYDVPYEASLKR